MSYDALGCQRELSYPAATQESVVTDAVGNPIVLVDANGKRVTQSFHEENWLVSRTIVLESGVDGPTAESFTY